MARGACDAAGPFFCDYTHWLPSVNPKSNLWVTDGLPSWRRVLPFGYMIDMATPPAGRTTVQINLRVAPDVLEALDQWIEQLNTGRRLQPATRNGVLNSLLLWGLQERPSWAGGDPPSETPTIAEVRKAANRLQAALAEARESVPETQAAEPEPAPPHSTTAERVVELDEAPRQAAAVRRRGR